MPYTFPASQGQISVRMVFLEPETTIFDNLGTLCRHLLRRLGTVGLRLADMKLEQGDTLADTQLRCYLFNFRGNLNIRAERVEVTSNIPGPSAEQLEGAFVESVAAIREHLPSVAFASFTTDVGMHGVIAGQPPATITQRVTQNAPIVGPLLGSGSVFYFGPEAERLSSTLTIDLSAVVEGGIFVRSLANWDATKVSAPDLGKLMVEHLRRSLEALDLEIPRNT